MRNYISASNTEVMKLTHSNPLAGHLEVSKSICRILSHFYWPGIRSDVRKFCRECHVCQVVGNPNQQNPIAHIALLKPIPAFYRIMIDCVGPLPSRQSVFVNNNVHFDSFS